jgi:DNA-binding SARP family transcriptional activator
MPNIRVKLLGDFRVFQDGHDISDSFSERIRLLFSFLLINSETSIPRKKIAYTFWPDSTESQARTNLRNLLHRLRKSLQLADTLFEYGTQDIRVCSDALINLDVHNFLSYLASANSSLNISDRISYLQEGTRIYSGELLPDFYEDWILKKREELNHLYINALLDQSALLEDNRQYKEAIQVINQLIRNDPLNEVAYQNSMRLHALNNDRTGALKIYHTCTKILRQELDVEPLPETQFYYKQILQIEDGIDEDKRLRLPPEIKKIIGRQKEWQSLRNAWKTASQGKPGAVLLLGEAGVGKTRLALELAQWTRRQGIHTAFSQCYSGEGELPYAPIVDWLRVPEFEKVIEGLDEIWRGELARLLPELQNPTETARIFTAMDHKWQRRRLFEAIAKGLLDHGRPLLLVLDDAHWSDRDTLDFIHFLLQYEYNASVLIVLTARTEELTHTSPVSKMGGKLQSKGNFQEVELKPLDKAEVQELVTVLTNNRVNEKHIDRLYSESEGNPLFVIEMLRSGDDPVSSSIPFTIQSLLEYRINQLSPSARKLAGIASAIGREFSYQVLKASSEMDEDTLIDSLDELWLRRIIQNQQEDSYNFTHGKLRDTSYGLLNDAHRRLIHKRIAETMISIYKGDEDLGFGLTAKHFELAGLYDQAVEQYLLAANTSGRVFANSKVIHYLKQAQALIMKMSTDNEQKKLDIEVKEKLGDIYEIIGRREDSLDNYSKALEEIAEEVNLTKARILGKIAKIRAALYGYEHTDEDFHRAMKSLGDQPNHSYTDWWEVWLDIQFEHVWVHYNLADFKSMKATLDSLVPVIERINSVDKIAAYKFNLVGVHLRRDRYQLSESTKQLSWEALLLCKEHNISEYLIRATIGYGLICLWSGDFDNAWKYLEDGLKLAEHAGDIINQIVSLTYLAVTNRLLNKLEACYSYADKALDFCVREEEITYAASAKANLGWVALRKGELHQAKKMCFDALEEWSDYYPFRWLAAWPLIDIHAQEGNFDQVVELVHQILDTRQQALPEDGLKILCSLEEAFRKGKSNRVASILPQAIEWAQKGHYL